MAPTLSRRAVLLLAAAATVALVGGCGGEGGSASSSGQAGTARAPVAAFRIVAAGNRWDLRRVYVPVGREVSVEVDNRDAGVAHNLHVRLPADARTEVAVGVVLQRLRFVAPAPGEFEFLCDVHPFMTGTVVAVAHA